ncbi:PREDICTED: KH domain-containing, RNA-binding, signal transduction-associated protein 2-like [Rhagoletis zephyria]|uniref:KH domain-containing, RNA-binding, signal transduction-associated protein 2-like n=1 Tax=Rhagoletis zephyria TaxID=28612 RepID=UPI0008114F72|nr:PREDICTED: KH domain-containing, RNA-binding, signal transduction-associated protein 2-like [Rhagoletis zephyria]XP_036324315.1 KH domain-containing, RNA-binding, signal transduction-associated protein 2-like [Rhagoletis pomonella]
MSEHSEEANHIQKEGEFDGPRINHFAQKFLDELKEERERLSSEFPLCAILIEEAIERICSTGRVPGRDYYADVYKQKPMKLVQKVFVPVKQYPKFNFSGKILGPKGNSLRRLQDETRCRILIKGRGSIRNHVKEDEMRKSGDPRHSHLKKDLFVEISTVATPAESYARVAYALAEIRKYLIPDKNDDVAQEQLRELMEIDPKSAKQFYKSVYDQNIAANEPSKYLNFAKQYAYQMEEPSNDEESEEEVHEARIPKRTIVPAYERTKAKIVPSTLPYKRPPTVAIYGTQMKRFREAPVRPTIKPVVHGILKKYK